MTTPLSPEAVAQMVARLHSSCVGQPAKIAWPHRPLHDAADMLTTLAAENATLRASEAAVVERLKVALEIAKTRHIPDQPAAYGGSELEWAQRQYASLRRDIIAALPPQPTRSRRHERTREDLD